MLKRTCQIGCVMLVFAMIAVSAWAADGPNVDADDLLILARGNGHGPGDGTGNGGSGPGDGTGNGSESGDCPNLKTDVKQDLMIIAGRGNGGKGSGGNGGKGGQGKGSGGSRGGNGGVCPWGMSL